MDDKWIAHIRTEADGSKTKQSVSQHCRSAANYAKDCLAPLGLGSCGYLAGLHHDDGKRTKAFEAYLLAADAGQSVQRGSVVHSFTGTRFLLDTFHGSDAGLYEKLTAELLAYAIGAHHGLFDCVDENGRSGFLHRQTRPDVGYEEAIGNLPETCQAETAELFQKATAEISGAVAKIQPLSRDAAEMSFYFGLLSRLLVSAVIEGDRRDTSEFMQGVTPAESVLPDWEARLSYMEERLRDFPANTALAQARQQISQICRDFGERPSGIYRLNVPTGAGKTLSSLRYALAHAAKWGKSRIIFTSPLLSILEQNAAVLRDFIGDPDMVLEHHSNVVREKAANDELDRGELLAESWSAPVIITTLVQLLNTCFSGKTQSIRRFQGLVNSVIVIDEVQTVPAKMLSLFNLTLNFLASVCSATIVLCSATQPCLEKTPHSLRAVPPQIVPYNQPLWAHFCRTKLVDAGGRKLEEIPDFAREILEKSSSLLIICNKKEEARVLSQALADLNCFHLSAAMCPAHRRNTLASIERLLGKKKLVCVSTQVMEAGVDISFDCVIRLAAGMDSVVQAAGRCNRNCENQAPQSVYLLNCTDENLGRLREIQDAKMATIALLDKFRRNPDRYGGDLASDQAITDYYQKLYHEMSEDYQDFSLGNGKPTLYQILSDNYSYRQNKYDDFILGQAFLTAGRAFQVFDSDTISVLVPYGAGRELIGHLGSQRAQWDLTYVQSLLQQAKPYQVTLYQYQFDLLEQAQGLGCDPKGNIYWLEDGWYDEIIGVATQRQENSFLEV